MSARMEYETKAEKIGAEFPKFENHAHAVALHFMYYNFVRIHQSLKITPAMAAKVTDRLWEIVDIVEVLENWEANIV